MVRSQLLQILRSRRDAIADSWYQAIARASQVPLEAAEVRQRLVELTEQAIAFLLTEPFEHGKAQEIGAALARLRYVQPEALGRTLEILARQLVQDLPAEQAVALQPHLAALLGAVAAGFFHEAREIILAEQEQIRGALVSEIHRTEEALQESELRYRTLFESAPTGIGLATLDGEILASNAAMLQMTGYSEVELRQINLRDTYQNPEERVLLLKQLQTNGFVRDFEVTLKRKDGTPYYASLTVIPLTLGSKDLLLTLAEDITARKRAEQQAIRAERLAAMGWLATALAHEINNPLQAIRSNLELALDFDLEPDEHEGYLQVVRQEVERLAEITRRVLDFAQPADDTRYPVSIARLTQKTLRLIGKQLALAHVQATTDFPADLPPVFAAPDQIVQVLLNLSINAIEAMPDGGHLHITGRVDGDAIALTLANDGPPLPAEHIKRIFDPFFTAKPEGTGLGLPISHSIVHRHGGTISAENLEGNQGVAFTVTLPIAHVARLKETSA